MFKGIRKYKDAIDKLAANISINRYLIYCDCIISRIKYGCVINHYTIGGFYKRSNFERCTIFTYRHWKKVMKMVNCSDKVSVLENKIEFNTYYNNYIKREWLYSYNMTRSQFHSFITKHSKVIIKPIDGWEGDGVSLINFDLHSAHDIDSMYEYWSSKNILMEECVVQHPQMCFGSNSVNTIRMYSAMDINGDIHLIKSVVRVGIGDSIVDNSHAGGCAYEVDLLSGYIVSGSYQSNGHTSITHPGTDICMLGKKIPMWDDVCSLCKQAASMLPECRFIGWDIAITESGPLLIEGNHNPDLDMIEFVGSYGYKDVIMQYLHI